MFTVTPTSTSVLATASTSSTTLGSSCLPSLSASSTASSVDASVSTLPRVFVYITSPLVSSLEEGEPLFVANLKSINDVLVFDTT